MIAGVNPTHQAFIMARLSEFGRYDGKTRLRERDPWAYMRGRLLMIEPVLQTLKAEALGLARARLLASLQAGPLDDRRCAEFRELFEKLLCRADFVDVALHLLPGAGPEANDALGASLARAQPVHIFQIERLPPDARDPNWDRLIAELYERLGMTGLATIRARRKLSLEALEMTGRAALTTHP